MTEFSRRLAVATIAALTISLAIWAAGAGAVQAQPALAEFEVQKAIEYATHDGVKLEGDLYVPKAAGKYPVMITVHGGGWQVGNRTNYQFWGNWLAARGIAVFSITYRLSKPAQKTYPQAVNDLRAAVQFVKGHAAALKLDPERVGLIGDSAGGHLVALVALAGDDPAFAGAYPQDPFAATGTKVKAVVGAYGVYDMTQQFNHDLLTRPQDSIVQKFLGSPPWDNRKMYFESSPMSWVTSDKKATSFLLTYGTEDDIVDRQQSDAFLLALKQAGFYARNVVHQGIGHFWMTADPVDDPRGAAAHLAPRLLRFLAERL